MLMPQGILATKLSVRKIKDKKIRMKQTKNRAEYLSSPPAAKYFNSAIC